MKVTRSITTTTKQLLTRLMLVGFVVVLAAMSAVSVLQNTSNAASLSNWKAGLIMDDAVMINKNTMSVSQIQSFLNGKVPTCDTNGTKPSEMGNANVPDYNKDGVIQRWEWGKYYYNQTTFPCLRDYKDPTTGLSSAQTIYNSAQKYSINPQVLITLLQKEQGLVTDTWPLSIQYRSATGYGCPDTAACDSQYYGLTNQLNWSATMFRAIQDDNPNWYSPYTVGNNYIQYNPNSSCKGSTVNIQNRATQSLYDYTPYQPNAAALSSGYGSGDSCSSYGNRNFYLYFNDWFGPSYGKPVYTWSVASQELYSDSGLTTKISNNTTLTPGQRVYMKVAAKNTGNEVWYQPNLHLATSNPHDRLSPFQDTSWLSANRLTGLQTDAIAPGATGTFVASLLAPKDLGTYTENYSLVLDGKAWFNDPGMAYNFTVASASPYYYIKPLSYEVYADAAYTKQINPASFQMYTGKTVYGKVLIKNTGNQTLPASSTKLAPSNPEDRTSVFKDGSWIGSNRVATLKSGDLLPGQTGEFDFQLTAPTQAGQYQEQFGVVLEGTRWLSDNVASSSITVSDLPPSSLSEGSHLAVGSLLLSGDERYRLVLQSDGNLVIYSPNRAIWSSWTVRRDSSQFILQGDGNLVIYDSTGKAVWNSRTNGENASKLIMQSDGNLVLYSTSGKALWYTHTNGVI